MNKALVVSSVLALVSFFGCGAGEGDSSADASSAGDAVQYYDGTGVVIAVTEDHVQIDHQEIPGFMDAMTMSFEVADPALLEGLEPGTRITFRVAVAGRSAVVDRIEPISE